MVRQICRVGLAMVLVATTFACSGKKEEGGATAEAPKAPASGSQAAEATSGIPAGPIAKVNGVEVSRGRSSSRSTPR
jgi:hypothetical protein